MKKVEKKGKGLHAARRDVFFALRGMALATDNEEVASPAAAVMARRATREETPAKRKARATTRTTLNGRRAARRTTRRTRTARLERRRPARCVAACGCTR